MKIYLKALLICMIVSTQAMAQQNREYYQLKTYTFANENQQKATDEFLSKAFLPALHRQGIKNIGVFKMIIDEKQTVISTYVLIPFSSLDQFESLETKLLKDKQYFQAGTDYINAKHDNASYQRIESTLMKAFVEMPMMKTPGIKGPRNQRIYELRSYESPTEQLYLNKVDMFNAGGEVALFEKLQFNAVFYAEVLSGAHMPNLVYMTTHENATIRDKNWDAFRNAPEWKALKEMEKYKNNVSKADIWLLQPTEYSDY